MKILSVKNIEDAKFQYIPFDGEWYQAFGRPERSGCWIVYGKSGQGKTHFALLLARKLDELGMRVLFLSLEMGVRDDFQKELELAGIRSGVSRIQFSEECEGIEDIEREITKQRSADVVFVDSVQYLGDQCGVKAKEIIALRRKYPKKMFIFISHVEGKEVEGPMAYDVKKDSFRRIYIDRFKASHISRGAGGPRGYFIIWDKGYQKHWLENIKEQAYENNND